MTGKAQIQAALSAVGLVSLVALLLFDYALVVDATPTPLPTKPALLTNQPASVTPVPDTKVPPPPLPPTMTPTKSTPQPTAPPTPADCANSFICTLCVEKSTCGWNGYTCTFGDSTGPQVGSASSWQFYNCTTSPPSSSGFGVPFVIGLVAFVLIIFGCCFSGWYNFYYNAKIAAERAHAAALRRAQKSNPATGTNTAQAASLLQGGRTNQAARTTCAAAVPALPRVCGTAINIDSYGTSTSDHLVPEAEAADTDP